MDKFCDFQFYLIEFIIQKLSSSLHLIARVKINSNIYYIDFNILCLYCEQNSHVMFYIIDQRRIGIPKRCCTEDQH